MYVQFYTILCHVQICVNTTAIKIQTFPFTSKISPVLSLYARHPHYPEPLASTSLLYIYNFDILRMLYKWNNTLCNLIRGLFFFFPSSIMPFECYQSCVHFAIDRIQLGHDFYLLSQSLVGKFRLFSLNVIIDILGL